jgi:hypothetical protein
MDELLLEVRRRIYDTFVREQRVLRAEDPETEAAFRELHDAHALVLHPGTTEIWMLNPFSTVPTPHRAQAGGRWWYGNCAWDALGIPGALHADGRIESECADCGEPLVLEVRDGTLVEGDDLLVHILVPARHWWDDIGFT